MGNTFQNFHIGKQTIGKGRRANYDNAMENRFIARPHDIYNKIFPRPQQPADPKARTMLNQRRILITICFVVFLQFYAAEAAFRFISTLLK